MSINVVCAENVSRDFAAFKAVDKVSFEIKKGECFGLLGPNGAGKSTLINMIYGALSVSDGELRVFGLDPMKDSRSIKKRLGVVTQENALDTGMNVDNNMMLYARFMGLPLSEREERVGRLLKFMSLEHKKKAPIRALSGGMQRRLAFVRALLSDPDCLILDEPTTGLDPAVRMMLWAKIQELISEEKTVLLTTHYMDEAEVLCDRIVIMDEGQIKAIGAPKDLILEHCPGYIAIVKSTAENQKKLETLNDSFRLVKEMSGLHIRAKQLSLLTDVLEKLEIIPRLLRPTNLEDAFLAITGRELSNDA